MDELIDVSIFAPLPGLPVVIVAHLDDGVILRMRDPDPWFRFATLAPPMPRERLYMNSCTFREMRYRCAYPSPLREEIDRWADDGGNFHADVA